MERPPPEGRRRGTRPGARGGRLPRQLLPGGKQWLAVFPLFWLFGTDAVADGLTGTVRLTSDYVYRGYSRSDGHPAVQANLDYGFGGAFYGGVWVSTIDFATMDRDHEKFERREGGDADGVDEVFDSQLRANVEISPYLGTSVSLNKDWRLDEAVAGYIYDGRVLGAWYNYAEVYTQIHYQDLFTARVGVAPAAYGYEAAGVDIEFQARYPVTDIVEVSGAIGYDTVTAVPQYSQLYWMLGTRWYIGKCIALDVRYFGSQAFLTGTGRFDPPAPLSGGPIIASFSIGF